MVSRGVLWVAAVLLATGGAVVALAVRATTEERPLGPGVVLLERATPLTTATAGPTSSPGLRTVQPAPVQSVETDDDDSDPADHDDPS